MAAHCSIIAWEIPWTEEPGGLQSDLTEWLTNKHAYVKPLAVHLKPLPHRAHVSALCVCISAPALQIGSLVPFSRFHMYVLIYDIWLCFPVF